MAMNYGYNYAEIDPETNMCIGFQSVSTQLTESEYFVAVPVNDPEYIGKFYINGNKKATAVRFASAIFDKYKGTLGRISDFTALASYLGDIELEQQFLDYADRVDGLKPMAGEWEAFRSYMMPQINGLVGRFSKVGEEAFYRFYLPVDESIKKALEVLE